MTEIMAMPAAQNNYEVQKYFNKLTALCFEMANIQAQPIPFYEIKEIATAMLTKECFQQDRTLINSRHGHRRPHNLSDIIQIWRQCAEEIRQYTGRSTSSMPSSSKIAATRAIEETTEQRQWSDEEEEEVTVAAFTSRPSYPDRASQSTFSDSRSYYDNRNTLSARLPRSFDNQQQQQQRPPSRSR